MAACSESVTARDGGSELGVREGGVKDTRVGDTRGGDRGVADGPGADLGDGPPAADTIDPTLDSDGDGLPDVFENQFASLDAHKADSDGDGIGDADEDDDKDGLTAAEELAARVALGTMQSGPGPETRDLLVEVDYQVGRAPSKALLDGVAAAYRAVDLVNIDGSRGVNVYFFIDERDLPVANMPSSLGGRGDYLRNHGPKNLKGAHVAKMLHLIFASERPDASSRGGETVGESQRPPADAGVLIYGGNLDKIFPVCGAPSSAAVSVDEALLSTTIHELGHTLQLGHDTSVGGGVNPYNIMATSLPTCDDLKKRTRGVGNTNPALGAIESVGAPRFSTAAAKLMRFDKKLSVEVSQLDDGDDGYEM
ncbi:MAG: hypothetical protein KC503_01550 [Myxococcales bacterium]|nr:hypothetical protein [Myxococcales bacterium]